MLEKILVVTGKPGLYKLLSQGRQNLIVETLDAQKKRMPIFSNERVSALGDIAMYTDSEDVPLKKILKSVLDKENGKECEINPKTASSEELRNYFTEILPNWDQDRVHDSDIKKLLSWYNIIVRNGIDFSEDLKEESKDAQ